MDEESPVIMPVCADALSARMAKHIGFRAFANRRVRDVRRSIRPDGCGACQPG